MYMCTVHVWRRSPPRYDAVFAQTVDYAANRAYWLARRDALTVHSSGGGDGGAAAVYSGGKGCDAQGHYKGVCSGAPPAGTTLLRTGDTLTWAAGADNQKVIAYHYLHAATSGMAGWELCFAH